MGGAECGKAEVANVIPKRRQQHKANLCLFSELHRVEILPRPMSSPAKASAMLGVAYKRASRRQADGKAVCARWSRSSQAKQSRNGNQTFRLCRASIGLEVTSVLAQEGGSAGDTADLDHDDRAGVFLWVSQIPASWNWPCSSVDAEIQSRRSRSMQCIVAVADTNGLRFPTIWLGTCLLPQPH